MDRWLTRFERWLVPVLGVLLAFIALLVFIQVCLRYLFNLAFLWGEELSLFAFIWCIFLGAALNVRRRKHFAMDVLAQLLRGRAGGVQRLLIDLVVLAVSLVMLVEGYRFSILSLQRFSPALGITLFVPTLIIPISAAYMILVGIGEIIKGCRWIVRGRAD